MVVHTWRHHINSQLMLSESCSYNDCAAGSREPTRSDVRASGVHLLSPDAPGPQTKTHLTHL